MSVTKSAKPIEPTVAGAVAEFEAAWNDPRRTPLELPPVDVNRVLAAQYQVDPPTRMTRTQVWDMEVKKAWLNDGRGRVLEDVFTDVAGRRVIFLGQARLTGPNGETLLADSNQPLFHVQHGAHGAEDDPINTWRIVLLTESADPRYAASFAKATAAGGLPGFLEIYLKRDLGVTLHRR